MALEVASILSKFKKVEIWRPILMSLLHQILLANPERNCKNAK